MHVIRLGCRHGDQAHANRDSCRFRLPKLPNGPLEVHTKYTANPKLPDAESPQRRVRLKQYTVPQLLKASVPDSFWRVSECVCCFADLPV